MHAARGGHAAALSGGAAAIPLDGRATSSGNIFKEGALSADSRVTRSPMRRAVLRGSDFTFGAAGTAQNDTKMP
jgi:hypothetical protein